MSRYFLATSFLLLASPWLPANTANSLLDLTPDGTQLLVANTDSGTVTLVDLRTRKKVREIAVGDHPEGVTWISSGPLAAVTVYRDNLLLFVDTESGAVVKKLPVPHEPYGIVTNKAGTKAWVTHDYLGLVSEIDLQAMTVLRQIKVAPYLRGIAYREAENRLYVSGWYTANLYAVDLEQGKVVDEWKGSSTDNLSRQVALHPTRHKAYLAHLRSRITAAHGRGSIFPHVSFVDLVPNKGEDRRRSMAMDTFNFPAVQTNPWEAALTPDGKKLFVIYAGTNDMNVCPTIDDDFHEIERGRLISVGQNPRAVRVSPDGKWLYVYNALDFDIRVIEIATLRTVERITTCAPPMTPEWVRGKILFSTANAPMTSARWIACSSCHPDGGHDGRVWQNPEGLRRTTGLFGVAHTHPLHWSADRDEVQDFEYTIRGLLMGGRGLTAGPMKTKKGHQPIELKEKMAGRSADLDALAIYSNSFTHTLSPHIPAPGKLSPAAERGKKLFFSPGTKCATCHSGPYYTDSSLQKPFNLHDVGTGKDDPSEKMGPKYDTPSLIGVYRQTCYLHHGKAKSLQEVLTKFNPNDQHGKTSHLKPEEIEDLVEFLKSLPYEVLPDETPNTVKYRVTEKGKK
jgi:YVTN family beta-propeller protein